MVPKLFVFVVIVCQVYCSTIKQGEYELIHIKYINTVTDLNNSMLFLEYLESRLLKNTFHIGYNNTLTAFLFFLCAMVSL